LLVRLDSLDCDAELKELKLYSRLELDELESIELELDEELVLSEVVV
jgi:hypothetical protein